LEEGRTGRQGDVAALPCRARQPLLNADHLEWIGDGDLCVPTAAGAPLGQGARQVVPLVHRGTLQRAGVAARAPRGGDVQIDAIDGEVPEPFTGRVVSVEGPRQGVGSYADALIAAHREAGDAGRGVAVAVVGGHRTPPDVTAVGRELLVCQAGNA